ncbi:hypothetical protein [Streptomyces sp. NPDC058612]|uniref:hypothetical protein n=1 Tax=Streptomyces sp. NPDC058612 TaxID=3346555 RepID=UPI003647DFAC
MGQNDDRGPDVSDEEWARFSAQAGQGGGDAPREPSARARMVTERLRREEAERARAGRGLFRRTPRQGAGDPPGWRTGPAWQEREGRGTGKRRLKATLAVVCIAALAVVALRPELVIDRITGKAEDRRGAGPTGPAAPAAPLAGESARPSEAPAELYPDRPTLTQPFRGSPALQWADGAAGIEVPEAAATGGMTKDQVADALAKAKQFLVAANLDPATLRGEQPAAALSLLDPKDKRTKDQLAAAFARPSLEQNPLDLFSRYDPAELRLVGEVVKVRGRMWVEPGEGPGQAHVVVDYSFVYPFAKARGGADQVERTIVRREATFSIADPRKWTATPGRLWIVAYRRDIANSSCDKYDGYLHPTFVEDPATGPTPSGTPMDPYDRSKTIEESSQEGCTAVSRS